MQHCCCTLWLRQPKQPYWRGERGPLRIIIVIIILAGRSVGTPPLLLLLGAAGAPLNAELLLLLGLAAVPLDCEAPLLLATSTVVDLGRPGGLPLLRTPAALLIGCPVTRRVARRDPDTGC
jgi:hypothetical protein